MSKEKRFRWKPEIDIVQKEDRTWYMTLDLVSACPESFAALFRVFGRQWSGQEQTKSCNSRLDLWRTNQISAPSINPSDWLSDPIGWYSTITILNPGLQNVFGNVRNVRQLNVIREHED